jgi:chromosome segregation ATPase
MREPADSQSRADLALAVYLEPFAEDRRVLLLGDAGGSLAERLEGLCERLDIIDPAAREPSRGPVPELPFDDAVFDLVLVLDVSALPDPRPDAVRELRRVLTDDGVLALCTQGGPRRRRRSGPPQDVLDKLLTPQFRYVHFVAQQPLGGYTLLDLEAGEDEELSIDASLVRKEPPESERYLALGSDLRLRVEPKLWVQLPRDFAADEAGPAVSPEFVRKLEDDAREAAQREADAVRALEAERKARAEAEHRAERARGLERRLRDAEGDYDDAVARLRFLESELSERDGALENERKRRESAEHELKNEKAQGAQADARVRAAEAEREAARADAEALATEVAELEKRVAERGQRVAELERDVKAKEVVARDLLEELRRLEQHRSADVEHDARVAELEAERDRAVQRALEAEVAREAAQMRVDELRAQQLAAQAPERSGVDAEVEGTLLGLRMRVAELEQRLAQANESRASREPVAPAPVHSDAWSLSALTEAARHDASDRHGEESVNGDSSLSGERTLNGDVYWPEQSGVPDSTIPEAAPVDDGTLSAISKRARDLELRLLEAETALARAQERALRAETVPPPQPMFDAPVDHAGRGERTGLAFRLRETEAALAAAREAKPAPRAMDFDAVVSTERVRYEAVLAGLNGRIDELEQKRDALEAKREELERELEEADRAAEAHAEDSERIEALEFELEATRRRLDAAEDELRSLEESLRSARAEAENAALEASARVELAQRRESDARNERDAARAALEEARAMLAQLAAQGDPVMRDHNHE